MQCCFGPALAMRLAFANVPQKGNTFDTGAEFVGLCLKAAEHRVFVVCIGSIWDRLNNVLGKEQLYVCFQALDPNNLR